MAKTRVLVVDDSAFMRKVISDMISQDPSFEVIGTAGRPRCFAEGGPAAAGCGDP